MKTKTGRRFLSTIIALVMLLSTGTICFSSLAAEGETVTDGDITYVISNGCITDVTVKDDAVLENYTVPAKVGKISINSIGECAYLGTKITTLTIPETVTSIGGGAFRNCNLLEAVYFDAYNIEERNMPHYTSGYEDSFLNQSPIFYNDSSLTKVVFGEKVTKIPAYACTAVFSLKTVIFNRTVSEIGKGAFYGCSSLSNIDLSNLTKIGESAFYGCKSLGIIDLPKAKNIGAEAFMSCGNPSKVSFPKAMTIGDCAFAKTNMVTLTIPETVTSIGGGAFRNCNSLEMVYFDAYNIEEKNMPHYTSGYEDSFLNQSPIFYNDSSLTKVVFGEKVTKIPAYACTAAFSLETVEFKTTVSEIGENAFCGCSALNIRNEQLEKVEAIDTKAFYGCNALNDIKLPEAVTIAEDAFATCRNLASISFSKAKIIGDCAFMGTNISSIIIPNTVEIIGGGAFRNCNSLEAVYFDAYNIEERNMPHYTSGYEDSFLNQSPIFYNDSSLTKVVFGEKVTKIPAYACTAVFSLETVDFRAAVTEIGKNAFYGCPTPDEITFAGTEAQWNTLKENSEGTGNESLFKCTNIKYNSIPVTEYTVTFNANGGAVTPKTQKVAENTVITLPTTTKVNYTFLGWSLDKNAATATYPAGSTYKVTGNVTLYAVWKAIDKPVEKTFTDSASDVQVTDNNNAFDGKDVKINVEVTSSDAELDKKIHDFALTKASEIYNIFFTYNGKEIQPNGMVKVRIPYDKEIKDSSKIKVFHYHKNSNGEMVCSKISNITVIPGYIEFETDSFSKFVVTEDITVTIEGNSKMQYKGTQTLNVNVNAEVEFTSSNPKVVSVDKKTGKVTATGKGTATITATVKGTDVSSSINITVSYTWWQWLIKIVLFGWIWY